MSTPKTIVNDIYSLIPESGLIIKTLTPTPGTSVERIMELYIDGQLWMNNNILRDNSHRELYSLASGNVLIAGLGIGGDVLLLKDKVDINSIHVVENSQDVIDAIWTLVSEDDPKLTIHYGDIIEFLNTTTLTFDVIWFDTFIQQGFEIPDELDILRQAALPKLNEGGTILFWRDPQPQGE